MKNTPNQPRSQKPRRVKSSGLSVDDERHKVIHNYHDHSHVSFADIVDMQGAADKPKGPRGGVTVPFPTKLHVMLSKVEENGLAHIISWKSHGRCFVIHKPKEFVNEVMPTYFRQSKLTSFQRQLNLYGFSRITTGTDRGGYYHECFLKHKLFLCQKMSRIRIKGTGIKAKASPETEPDFYSMPFLKPEPSTTELNRDLEHEVTAALEDENKRACRESGKKEKKVGVADMFLYHHSPDHNSMGMGLPAVVTPDSRRSKKMLSVPSLLFESGPTTTNTTFKLQPNQPSNDQEISDCFPPLLSSEMEEPHPGDEITFEGEHFHYLDSFVAYSPPPFFSLAPRNEGDLVTQQNHDVFPCRPLPSLPSTVTARTSQDGISSNPLIECNHPESVFSMAQSLREPIMSPYSSSASSLDEIFQHRGSLRIDTDTIFSEDFGGDWEIGRDVSMDAYFP